MIRYTRQRMHRVMDIDLGSEAYEVIGSDSDSVAILSNSVLHEEPRITHIHFEGDDYYWVNVEMCPPNLEWFKRVSDD